MLAFNSSRFNAMFTFKVATNYNVVELNPGELVHAVNLLARSR